MDWLMTHRGNGSGRKQEVAASSSKSGSVKKIVKSDKIQYSKTVCERPKGRMVMGFITKLK